MSTEENSKSEQQKIKELLEEAAKRHREIEQKIHPDKFNLSVSSGYKTEITPVETIAQENDKVTGGEISTVVNEEKYTPPDEEHLTEKIETQEPEQLHVVEEKDVTDDSVKPLSLEHIELTEPVEQEKELEMTVPEASEVSGESKSILEAIETIISRHRSEETDILEEESVDDFTGIETIYVHDIDKEPESIVSEIQETPIEVTSPAAEEISATTSEVNAPVVNEVEEQSAIVTEEIIQEPATIPEIPEVPVFEAEIPEAPAVIIPPVLEEVSGKTADEFAPPVKEIEEHLPIVNEEIPNETASVPEVPIIESEVPEAVINEIKIETYTIDVPGRLLEPGHESGEETTKKEVEVPPETEQTKTNELPVEGPKFEAPPPKEKFITDFDTYLFSKGTFYKIYEKLGAHPVTLNGEHGVNFATWAPNAKDIYVIGEFNGWNESDEYRMESLGGSGLWSLFVPGLKSGDSYKFSIRSWVDDVLRRKADPYAFRSEVRPKNASIVADINSYMWNDTEWIDKRNAGNYKDEPMNIYEVHLGSWRRDWVNSENRNEWGYLSYGELAHEIVAYVKKMGYTHIELLPVMEHPLDISWGYQVTHYYAPTSRFGKPDDFMYFVDYCHQNGIGVILDWVPAHFPYDDHALAYFDGKQIYAYENIKRGIHKDWGTYIFDYGRPEVQNFLIGSALFWLEKYHADGLRVDAVASMLYLDYSREAGEWEPNIHGGREHLEAIAFLKHLNEKVHEYHRGTLMIAEESTSWPGVSHPVSDGGLGFDMKWNMGWMNDILLYFSKDSVYRKFHQGKITFSLWYAFSENFVLPISHDEVVHGKHSLLEKMPGDNWQKFANLRTFLGFMMGHPGKKLNFMTTDIGQYNEWNCETSMDWNVLDLDLNQKLNLYAKDLNDLYREHPSLFEVDFSSDGFRWIDFSDSLHSVLSFIRTSKDKKETLLFTFNMTPTVRYDYPIGVPEGGYWKEIMNSDAEAYGGSGVGNMGGKLSEPIQIREWQNSIKVNLPPLAVTIFVLDTNK